MNDEIIIDCFAGGGGASVGIEMALGRPVDIAINHDPDAILMHKTNHPDTLHLTEDIFKVDLQKYVKGRNVALMWASPDCTSHSKAKGGKPREKGLRILPWAVFKHARTILPDVIIMENVEEIQQWGPLDSEGHPIKERKGEEYKKFITAMKSLGYEFESRELVAADYGAPTTRKRWYAVFRRDGKKIVFPEQTHYKDGIPKWKECGNYIDWDELGKSIFDRPKPLADATMKRIANGIRKYVIDNQTPYIVRNENAVAFLIQYHGETKTGESRGQFLSEPLATITTKDRFGLVNVIIEIDGEKYIIKDIFLRMLRPEELKVMQGFPEDYIIDRDYLWRKYPISKQVARIGNSVVPIMAQKLVEANCNYLKIGERQPMINIDGQEESGQLKFA